MNAVLERWNSLDSTLAARDILSCCGSQAWAEQLAQLRPFADEEILFHQSDKLWLSLPEDAWQQAFDSHPRIGQQTAKAATDTSLSWSAEEQSAAATSDEAAQLALAEGNRLYEEKFGRIFIVCASGRSAQELLINLQSRMANNAVVELHEAAEQQRQITHIRLRRWLGGH